MVQVDKAEKFVINMLAAGLPAHLYYHNVHHTIDVVHTSLKLAGSENIDNEEDLMLLKTAALYHDCGFLHIYDNHEEKGCDIAQEVLPGFGYSPGQIKIICNMIMKTKLPQQPVTILEKILCDADLDHLGRDDFEKVGNCLYREWRAVGKISDEKDWNETQIRFLESHHYWTKSAISNREKQKQILLKDLKEKQLINR